MCFQIPFLNKLATESELVGPKIALWYFSSINILHWKKIKGSGFSGRLFEFHFVLKNCQKFKNVNFMMNWSWKRKLQTFIFTLKWGTTLAVVILHYQILFKMQKICFLKEQSKMREFCIWTFLSLGKAQIQVKILLYIYIYIYCILYIVYCILYIICINQKIYSFSRNLYLRRF